MPTYTQMPTRTQWEKDMKKVNFPAAIAINELLEAYARAKVRSQNFAPVGTVNFELTELAGHILQQTQYILKKQQQVTDKKFAGNAPESLRVSRDKLGVKDLTGEQWHAVRDLRNYCEQYLTPFLTRNGDFDAGFDEFFGRRIHQAESEEDIQKEAEIEWIEEARLKELKLRFRKGGVAHRMGADGRLVPYDSDDAKENREIGYTGLYVMDAGGHIYVCGNQGELALKHSSFFWTEPTRAAGTIRVKGGRIEFITAQSGHYKPTIRQMVNVLERLRGYGVNLAKVQFCRTNESGAWIGRTSRTGPARTLEPCNALAFLQERAFPGVHPQSLFIDRYGIGM